MPEELVDANMKRYIAMMMDRYTLNARGDIDVA